MITAKEMVSKRVVVGFAEERLVDVAGRMKPLGAQHCVVLDVNQRGVLGVIRLTDVASRSSSGTRILADLVSDVMPLLVREHEPATAVTQLFERQGICEAVVLSESGIYVGLISAESAFEWMQHEQRAARAELEELVGERERLNDILEKKVEQRSAELRAALEEFRMASGSLLHDVRSPLRSIRGFAEIIASGECGELNADGIYHAQAIKRAATKLELMAEEILAKAERAFAINSPLVEAVDLNVILDDATEFHRALLSERNALLTKRGLLHVVSGRYVPLLQIVANLLSNAVKYVPNNQRPVIEVWSEESPERVSLCIKDNGAGVSQRHQRQIFEPFVRLPGNRGPGLGLGLSIVKNAVLHVGGFIRLESEEGSGSLFTVSLRKAPPAGAAPEPTAEPRAEPAPDSAAE